MQKYDSIVVGCGFAGAVAARELAEKKGKKVLILDARDHVGGNCYDLPDEYGIRIHQYGPHIFHTNSKRVYEYLSRFTEWFSFGHEVVGNVYGKELPIPFNLNTLAMVFGERAPKMEEKLIQKFGEGARVPILELMNQEDTELKEIAEYVYENVFLKYTMKQWGKTPKEIDPSVSGRVPVLVSHDNRYFQDKYQGVPKEGFTPMFERMLDHENITVETGVDCKERLRFEENQIYFDGTPFDGEVIYTGALDELFDCQFGRLPYRSLRFDFEHYEKESYQGHSVVNYTVSEDFTRITEFKYLTGQKNTDGTTIVKEYPFAYTGAEGEIPYYAILEPKNQELYEKYHALAGGLPHFYLLGRLAEYKYYNIDAMTKKAMELADAIMAENTKR